MVVFRCRSRYSRVLSLAGYCRSAQLVSVRHCFDVLRHLKSFLGSRDKPHCLRHAQLEGASTPQDLPTQHARVRAVLRSREGSLPNQKRSSGVRRSFALAGFRSGSAPHWLSLGQRTRLTLRALVSEALDVVSTSAGQSSRV